MSAEARELYSEAKRVEWENVVDQMNAAALCDLRNGGRRMSRPGWWSADDSQAVVVARRGCPRRWANCAVCRVLCPEEKAVCRVCGHWVSDDGRRGRCGRTGLARRRDEGCGQWEGARWIKD